MSSAVINPVDQTQADVSDSVTKGNFGLSDQAIIAISIAIAATGIVGIIVIVGVVLYRRSIKRQNISWAQQLSQIDLKSINLGEAKSYIVSVHLKY